MEKRHIAVFTPLVGGHVYPALGLCAELANRGHRVTVPTNERFAARMREADATAVEFKVPEIRYAEKIIQDQLADDLVCRLLLEKKNDQALAVVGGVVQADGLASAA